MKSIEELIEIENLQTKEKFNLFYNEKYNSLGDYVFNVENAYNNLLVFTDILDKYNLRYYLIFGTLLGIYREQKLIQYDKDVDIFMFHKDLDDFLKIFHYLKQEGFVLIRITANNRLLSFVRKNEYLDIYFFNKKTIKNQEFYVMGNYRISAIHFNNSDFLTVNKKKFSIPKKSEKLLEFLYGSTWYKPKINRHYSPCLNCGYLSFLYSKICLFCKLEKIYSKLPKFIKRIFKFLKNAI